MVTIDTELLRYKIASSRAYNSAFKTIIDTEKQFLNLGEAEYKSAYIYDGKQVAYTKDGLVVCAEFHDAYGLYETDIIKTVCGKTTLIEIDHVLHTITSKEFTDKQHKSYSTKINKTIERFRTVDDE